jgi:outer membrane murein-binding lipoprotein Lpp
MKTLKITLAIVAIAVLTVSGVTSEQVVNDQPTYEAKSNFDLLATSKKMKSKPTNA